MNESDRDYLADMLDNAEFAISLLGPNGTIDRMRFAALCHAIQTIGEAANQVSLDGRAALRSVPWQKIIAMRNRLVHGYRSVAANLVVGTARDDLPPLIVALRTTLEEPPR